MSPLDHIRAAFRPALEAVAPAADVGRYLAMVRPAAPGHGDYQAAFAMPLGKVLGRGAREVAEEITRRLGV